MNIISKYASLVKFSHTIFALPFAMTGFFYGIVVSGRPFEWMLLVKVLLAMIFARNMAMGFNRWLDRDIDARNARTASRDIPAGRISPRNALWFVTTNAILFLLTALWINDLAFCLSPAVFVVLLGYSYTKHFTSWCHVVLGCALAIAPVGAYVAVTGSLTGPQSTIPLLLALLVLTWTAGFDIIYSLQDVQFDKTNHLHSVPVRFGVKGGLLISLLLHLISLCMACLIGLRLHPAATLFLSPGSGLATPATPAAAWYWTGAALFAVTLLIQHLRATPSRLDKMGAGFTTTNGIASLCYAVCVIISILID